MSMHSLQQQLHDSKLMKGVLIIVAVAMFVTAYAGMGNNLGSHLPTSAAQANAPDAPVATVNGDPIPRTEYAQNLERMTQQYSQMGQSIPPQYVSMMHGSILDQAVAQHLQLLQAKKMNLTVSDDEIQKERARIVTQSGLAKTLGLKTTASVADVDTALAAAGEPSVEHRVTDDQIRQELLLQKFKANSDQQVVVTEKDARDSFNQWHTQHILIGNKTRSDDQAKVQAQKILDMAKAPGANFVALAQKFSDDPGTKAKGGDDGWIDQSTGYVPEFKTAAFTLGAGQITPELVKSPQFGYFIIKCDAVKNNLPKDFDKNKPKYIAQVQDQKRSAHYQELVQKLRDDPANKVVVLDPALRADRTYNDAQRASDPVKRDADYKSALADYQAALKTNPSSADTTQINTQIASIYGILHQVPEEIMAYQKVVDAGGDPQFAITLGNLYLQQKRQDKALTVFAAASDRAWDNPQIHTQLQMAYNQMKRPDLVAKEQQWMTTYQKNQKQTANVGSQGLPPGVTMMPQGSAQAVPVHAAAASNAPTQAVTVHSVSGAPSKPAGKPAQ